jgi:hypothetical protein
MQHPVFRGSREVLPFSHRREVPHETKLARGNPWRDTLSCLAIPTSKTMRDTYEFSYLLAAKLLWNVFAVLRL